VRDIVTTESILDEYVVRTIKDGVRAREQTLIELRRDIHAHPETAWNETRTTRIITERLDRFGLATHVLEGGTGAVVDVVGDPTGPVIALRADLDALPLQDLKEVPYRSTRPEVAHACGHDVHTSALVGAAEVLRRLADVGHLPGTVRLLFQPAEEVAPGGALSLIEHGALRDVSQVFALHCDPHLEAGRLGTRTGPITAAVDSVLVQLSGPGGHTARPHLTSDLVGALADVVSRLPTLLSRRVDPRAGASVVWGQIHAGTASNAIPSVAEASGSVRVFERPAWISMRNLVPELIRQIIAPYNAEVEVRYEVGVPPTINDAVSTNLVHLAGEAILGIGQVEETPRSMGGEDFAWILARVPGSLARLGVRRPGAVPVDLHRGDFDVDERAVADGAMVFAAIGAAALAATP
jgi:amidohydrolase